MKLNIARLAIGRTAFLILAVSAVMRTAWAGREIAEPLRGELTLGIGGTQDRLSGGTDLTAPLWKSSDENDMIFLDGHWTGNSGHEEAYSAGLAYRHRIAGTDVILGVNAFWDHGIFHGQSFDQLGVGLEALTQWVDFRINGYFPEGGDQVFDHSQTKHRHTSMSSATSRTVDVAQVVDNNDEVPRTTRTTTTTTTTTTTQVRKTRTRYFETRETAMPGFDTELGFLIPGLDRYMETRIFGGFAFFDQGYDHDICTGTARFECRLLPALLVDADYKGDARLLDGRNHWFWGMRAEIPFDLGNLFAGKSPFAGITDAFTPKWMLAQGSAGPVGNGRDDKKSTYPVEQPARNRMNENIVRSWRPQVDPSDPIRTNTKVTTDTTVTRIPVKDVQVQTFFNGGVR